MKVIVDSLATHYTDEGHGPVILMLHGWANTLHAFDGLVSEMQTPCRIVRLDLPGFGGTEMPHEAWDVGEYARFVRNFCEKLKIEPYAIVGHSLGGRIAMKGFAKKILHSDKLVLFASAGVAERNTFRIRFYKFLAKLGKIILSPLPGHFYEKARQFLYTRTGGDYLTVGSMKGTFIKVIAENLSDAATKVTVPTLLVWGELDVVTPLSEGRRLRELIPNSHLQTLPFASHFVQIEKPRDCARLVDEFLK